MFYVTRFWSKVNKTDTCWLWTAAKLPKGYGIFQNKNTPFKTRLAHRISYEMLIGEIPTGMILDHICHVESCVNPEHLEVVTVRKNAQTLKDKENGKYTSMYSGVHMMQNTKGFKNWAAAITINNQRRFQGTFPYTPEGELSAKEAYEKALVARELVEYF